MIVNHYLEAREQFLNAARELEKYAAPDAREGALSVALEVLRHPDLFANPTPDYLGIFKAAARDLQRHYKSQNTLYTTAARKGYKHPEGRTFDALEFALNTRKVIAALAEGGHITPPQALIAPAELSAREHADTQATAEIDAWLRALGKRSKPKGRTKRALALVHPTD